MDGLLQARAWQLTKICHQKSPAYSGQLQLPSDRGRCGSGLWRAAVRRDVPVPETVYMPGFCAIWNRGVRPICKWSSAVSTCATYHMSAAKLPGFVLFTLLNVFALGSHAGTCEDRAGTGRETGIASGLIPTVDASDQIVRSAVRLDYSTRSASAHLENEAKALPRRIGWNHLHVRYRFR